MIDLASEETRRNPYALYRTVRALARVVREPTTGIPLDNNASERAARGPAVAHALLAADPQRHP